MKLFELFDNNDSFSSETEIKKYIMNSKNYEDEDAINSKIFFSLKHQSKEHT